MEGFLAAEMPYQPNSFGLFVLPIYARQQCGREGMHVSVCSKALYRSASVVPSCHHIPISRYTQPLNDLPCCCTLTCDASSELSTAYLAFFPIWKRLVAFEGRKKSCKFHVELVLHTSNLSRAVSACSYKYIFFSGTSASY